MALKVGQRFNVFEVDKHSYNGIDMEKGSWRVGTDFNGIGAELVSSLTYRRTIYISYGKYNNADICHKVATLVITRVK